MDPADNFANGAAAKAEEVQATSSEATKVSAEDAQADLDDAIAKMVSEGGPTGEKGCGMEQSDWEWADKALRDNRCSTEFAREAATRCEALRKQRDELSRACTSLVRWCIVPIIAELVPQDQSPAFLDAVRRAEGALAGGGDVRRFE